MDADQSIKKIIQAAKKNYASSLPEKIGAILHEWDSLKKKWKDADTFNTLLIHIHNISGTGATLGFHALSNAAIELENALNLLSPNKDATDVEIKQIQILIDHLEAISQDCKKE